MTQPTKDRKVTTTPTVLPTRIAIAAIHQHARTKAILGKDDVVKDCVGNEISSHKKGERNLLQPGAVGYFILQHENGDGSRPVASVGSVVLWLLRWCCVLCTSRSRRVPDSTGGRGGDNDCFRDENDTTPAAPTPSADNRSRQ